VRGRGVEVKVVFLDVFAVIPLVAGEAEEALLEDGILAVPKSEGETEAALAITPPQQPIFTPPVNSAARVIMRKIVPAFAISGIVFAYRAPLTFRQIGPPALPVPLTTTILGESD